MLSEELPACLASIYCSGSALAVLYRKNVKDWELSLERSGIFTVWDISGPSSPSHPPAGVCGSCREGEQRLTPQAALPYISTDK